MMGETRERDTLSSMTFRLICSNDLRDFKALQSEYLDTWTSAFLERQFLSYSDLYVGAFLRHSELVGVAYGSFDEGAKSAVLQGIAVKYSLWRSGIGSRLLRLYEEQVRKRGGRNVSLGSGEGFAEQFYLKNGYRAIEIKAKTEDGKVLASQRVRDYSGGLLKREHLRSELKPKEVIFIFEKEL